MPPAVPNLPEAAPLTEPVQPLLLDQLQDLGLDLLPQLPGVDEHLNQGRSRGLGVWGWGREGAGSTPSTTPVWALTRSAGTGSHPDSSSPTGAAAGSRNSSGSAVCS